ncbi:MAG: transglutaminase [Sphingomonas bacterium]|nr:transglutaminase family protein [Sphingomonas bacterium]MDB5689285.1 transglutaminase [Sphingomonas bacterium]
MPVLTVAHSTVYSYKQLVGFGDHRLMVRPRESYDQRLIEARLLIEPEPVELRWLHDVFGNAVAIARFDRRATELRFDSFVRMEHDPIVRETVAIESYARTYPFTYSAEDMPDLLRSIERQHLDPGRKVDDWARRFVRGGATDTLAMLADMTATIRREFTYVGRPEKGTQTPTETLGLGRGTCRDFAVLMIEAVRALGLAARFVSGYVYNPSRGEGRVGGGNTHAWVRVFLPGSGWLEFDPTNGIVGNRGLIRVAEARDPYQAVPLSGSFFGFPASYAGMKVSVEITLEEERTDLPLHGPGPSPASPKIADAERRS